MKNHLNKLILILFSLIAFQSKAYYTMGSEISYKCTSTPNVYTVTMKIYRDCSGNTFCSGCDAFPGNVTGCTTATSGWTMSITGGNSPCTGVNWGSFTLNAVSGNSGYDIVQTCNSLYTICTNCNTRTSGTFNPGIEVYTYEGNVNLSGINATCCKIILGATATNRKSSSTLSSTNYYTYCEINRCQSSCNSAPIFTNDATPAVCAGVDFVYNLGANDPDGDSLSYAFGNSLQSLNTPVNYISPYGKTNPFPYLNAPDSVAPFPGGLRIDPITGDIMFRPIGAFVSNLVLEVTQWKLVGGARVNVGITRRDIQFQSITCAANKAPIIKVYKNKVLQSGTNSFTAFAGVQFCLDIVAEDQGQTSPLIMADTTDLKWNRPGLWIPIMNNATFTRNYILSQRRINGPKADSFKLCWTPPMSAIRQEPYLFTATGLEVFCSIRSIITRGIAIKVEAPKTIFVDSTTKRNYCINKITSSNLNYQAIGLNLLPNNVFTAQLSDSSGSFTNATTIGTKNTKDTIGFIPVIFPLVLFTNSQYKIRINASSDTINLGTPYALNFVAGFNTPIISTNKDTLCKGIVATFKVTPNTPDLTFKWLKNNVLIANQTKDSLQVDSAYNYRVIVSNAVCSDTSSAKYLTVFSAGFNINKVSQCLKGNNFILTDTSNKTTGITKRLWSINNIDTSTSITTTKSFNNTGSYNVKLVVTSVLGCKDSITKTLNVYPNPGSSLTAIGNTTFCANSNITLKAGNTANQTFSWLKNDIQIPNIQDSNLIVNLNGTYKLVTKNTFNCIDTSAGIVTNTYPIPVINFTINKATQCLNGNSFTFTDSSNIAIGTINRKWNLGMGINDTSLLANIVKVYPTANTYTIKLVVTSNNGCKDSLIKNVIVSPSASANFTINNASQCKTKHNFVFTNTSTNSNTQTWSFGDATNSPVLSPTKIFANAGSYNVKLLSKNADNCNDSVTKTVVVNPEPTAAFSINNPSQCFNGNNFLFTDNSSIATGTLTRLWLFSNGDTSTNASVNKSYFAAGTFGVKLTVKSDKNCLDTISKTVTVLPKITIGNILGNINPTSTINPYSYSVLNQANVTYNWTANNGTIQTGQGTNAVSVVWTSKGAGSVNAKITNANNCTDTTNLAVNITTVGVNNFAINNFSQIHFKPNPFSTNLEINFTSVTKERTKLIITDAIGKEVYVQHFQTTLGDNNIITEDLSTLKPGFYMATLANNNGQSKAFKVIKN